MNKLTSYTFFYYTIFDGEIHSYGTLGDILNGLTPTKRIANMLWVEEDNVFVYAIIEESYYSSELKEVMIKSMVDSILSKHNTEWIRDSLDTSMEARIRRIRERNK